MLRNNIIFRRATSVGQKIPENAPKKCRDFLNDMMSLPVYEQFCNMDGTRDILTCHVQEHMTFEVLSKIKDNVQEHMTFEVLSKIKDNGLREIAVHYRFDHRNCRIMNGRL